MKSQRKCKMFRTKPFNKLRSFALVTGQFMLAQTCLAQSSSAMQNQSGFIGYFKDEAGETNWQYVANFSSSVIILLMLLATVFLFFYVRSALKANKELKKIRDDLEERVKERTATLDESNRLLQQSNKMLEGEIVQHKDTTDLLRLSETYIKSILDSMPLLLIGLDEDLKITQWNNFAVTTTGMSVEHVQGKYLWDAYPSITLTPEQIKDTLESGKTLTIKHSQRGQYYFDITAYTLKGQQKTGLVILIDDITKQSKAENLLIQKDKFSVMGELAAAMAHDINIPLNSIKQSNEQLQDWTKNEVLDSDTLVTPVIQHIEKTRQNSLQASAIIQHLTQFSKNESQEKQLCAIPDIMEQAVLVARSMFSDTNGLIFDNIKLTRTYADDLPSVPCFLAEVQQVCISILRHACYSLGKKEEDNHKPEIDIDISKFYDSLWIKVQHNGRGLTNEEQMTIFEPFYQSDVIEEACNLENRLSFSYFIITEHHGGRMAVTSDINVGTTFHIQLELVD